MKIQLLDTSEAIILSFETEEMIFDSEGAIHFGNGFVGRANTEEYSIEIVDNDDKSTYCYNGRLVVSQT